MLPLPRRRAGRSCSSPAPSSCTSAARVARRADVHENVRGHLRFLAQAPRAARTAARARACCCVVALTVRAGCCSAASAGGATGEAARGLLAARDRALVPAARARATLGCSSRPARCSRGSASGAARDEPGARSSARCSSVFGDAARRSTLALWLLLAARRSARVLASALSASRSLRATRPHLRRARARRSACSPVSCSGTCSPSRRATRSSTSRACGSSSTFDELLLERVDEFVDGGLHPGYAFPLWHAFLALVAKLAGVDPADVVLHEASRARAARVRSWSTRRASRSSARRWLGVATLRRRTVGADRRSRRAHGGALRARSRCRRRRRGSCSCPRWSRSSSRFVREPTRARLALARGAGARARARPPDVRALPAARAGRLRRRAGACSSASELALRSCSRARRSPSAPSCSSRGSSPSCRTRRRSRRPASRCSRSGTGSIATRASSS